MSSGANDQLAAVRNTTGGGSLSMTQINDEKSALLRLPLELRLVIFAYALGGNRITLRGHGYPPTVTSTLQTRASLSSSFNGCAELVAPLLICRQIYSETNLLIYKNNTFVFLNVDAKREFHRLTCKNQRNAITAIKPCPSYWEFLLWRESKSKTHVFSRFPNLKTVYIDLAWGCARVKAIYLGIKEPVEPDTPEETIQRIKATEGEHFKVIVETADVGEDD
ncbi:hypothetical protein BDV96DRAFT_643654 [Lophiotrema nucula]|uniref:DUF7730 domain-containing protein n=1 Tax=Lophiotrema nucula TaxID=690887 RepID=A0A6A5ZJ03_9PLEO|nr:hypothetical protein BDV96DRAFT_643654 [Lophiotrema nucula]